jgi:hypothetical protein
MHFAYGTSAVAVEAQHFGGRNGSMAGNSASRASIAILPLAGISGMGRISRPVTSGFCATFFSLSLSLLLGYLWCGVPLPQDEV